MQMIALYKDPKGENVFGDSATHDVGLGSLPAQQQRELQLSTEDTLRRRIKQLENLLSTYTVRYYIIPHEYNIILSIYGYFYLLMNREMSQQLIILLIPLT